MITIYKFEIVVPDYEDKGQEYIKQALLCDHDTYGWVTNVEEKDVEFFDNRDDKQIKNLFGWQPLETAPRDGTPVLFFYGLRGCVCTAYYERKYGYKYEGIVDGIPQEIVVYQCWHLLSADFNDYHICCDEALTDCYWQPIMELPV